MTEKLRPGHSAEFGRSTHVNSLSHLAIISIVTIFPPTDQSDIPNGEDNCVLYPESHFQPPWQERSQ